MPIHRRVGAVLMAISVLTCFAAPLLSSGWMAEVSLLPQLTALKLKLFCESFYTDCVVDLETRHVLIACLTLFAAGLLAWLGVLGTTSRQSSNETP